MFSFITKRKDIENNCWRKYFALFPVPISQEKIDTENKKTKWVWLKYVQRRIHWWTGSDTVTDYYHREIGDNSNGIKYNRHAMVLTIIFICLAVFVSVLVVLSEPSGIYYIPIYFLIFFIGGKFLWK